MYRVYMGIISGLYRVHTGDMEYLYAICICDLYIVRPTSPEIADLVILNLDFLYLA